MEGAVKPGGLNSEALEKVVCLMELSMVFIKELELGGGMLVERI